MIHHIKLSYLKFCWPTNQKPVFSRSILWIVCSEQDGTTTEMRIQRLIQSLQNLIYQYVCRSLFKADRLMFALHLAHGMHEDLFQENVC